MKKIQFLLVLLFLLLSAPAWGGIVAISLPIVSGNTITPEELLRVWNEPSDLQMFRYPLDTPQTLTLSWPDCKDITIVVQGSECNISYEIRDGEIVLTGRQWKEPGR